MVAEDCGVAREAGKYYICVVQPHIHSVTSFAEKLLYLHCLLTHSPDTWHMCECLMASSVLYPPSYHGAL